MFGIAALVHRAACGVLALRGLALVSLATLFGEALLRVVALPRLHGLFAALLFDALRHLLALAHLLDRGCLAARLLLRPLRVAPVFVAFGFDATPLLDLRARLLTLFGTRLLALLAVLALFVALFLAGGTAVVLVVIVVATLLRERGRNAAHGEQGTEQRDGQCAGGGKALHGLSPRGATHSCPMRAVSGQVDESMLRFSVTHPSPRKIAKAPFRIPSRT